MLEVARPGPATAWSAPAPGPALDMSLITCPPSPAPHPPSHPIVVRKQREDTKQKRRRLRQVGQARKDNPWQAVSTISLSRSHDSAVEQKCRPRPPAHQCFFFSSQPRIVETAGPLSPAGRFRHLGLEGEGDNDGPVPRDWEVDAELYSCTHYLQSVPITILPSCPPTIPPCYSSHYSFSLEEKILGLA